jgi:hypothetical protein
MKPMHLANTCAIGDGIILLTYQPMRLAEHPPN